MNFIVHHVWTIVAVVLNVIGILAITAILEAWLDFNKTPKEPMYWCHKHGFFAEKHTLDLFPHLAGTGAKTRMCPSCYRDAVFIQPDKKAKV